ncbi:unnamed protein product [Closterium sp. NIES-54]
MLNSFPSFLLLQVEALVSEGRQVIIVTSGSVGVGRQKLRFQGFMRTSFKDLQKPQAELEGKPCAAIGQGELTSLYESLFHQVDVGCAQLLVTEREFADLEFRDQLRSTVNSLLDHRVVPIFNENDAISTRHVPYKDASGIFWDNDSLAALLSLELEADALILLSDIDGLYTGPPSDPDSVLINTYVKDSQDEIKFGEKSRVGRGGMTAKVDAALKAAMGGVTTVIASGLTNDGVLRVLRGELVGTLFHKDAHLWAVGKSGKSAARDMAVAARDASRKLQALSQEKRKEILLNVADALVKREEEIIEQNNHDVRLAEIHRVAPALIQRLKLKPGRINQLAEGIRAIAEMPDPIAETLACTEVAENLVLEKQRWPLGVLLVIFESRPDAMPQIAALAIRSGNGLLLKGGKEALNSNCIIHEVIASALPAEVGPALIGLVTSRDDISDLLKLDDVIDLVIPRGSNALVNHIKSHTKIAVLGHADGVCHVYVDKAASLKMAKRIILDAKMDYPAACNAMETLLIHEDLARSGAAADIIKELKENGIALYGGKGAAAPFHLPPAANLHHEYGSLECTVEIVPDIDAAIHHIHTHGSAHTDAIITEDQEAAKKFLASVDSAVVVHNASTRFSDGFRFGLGAEAMAPRHPSISDTSHQATSHPPRPLSATSHETVTDHVTIQHSTSRSATLHETSAHHDTCRHKSSHNLKADQHQSKHAMTHPKRGSHSQSHSHPHPHPHTHTHSHPHSHSHSHPHSPSHNHPHPHTSSRRLTHSLSHPTKPTRLARIIRLVRTSTAQCRHLISQAPATAASGAQQTANQARKAALKASEATGEAACFLFFLCLDFLDFFLCYVFWFLDRLAGENAPPCYCNRRISSSSSSSSASTIASTIPGSSSNENSHAVFSNRSGSTIAGSVFSSGAMPSLIPPSIAPDLFHRKWRVSFNLGALRTARVALPFSLDWRTKRVLQWCGVQQVVQGCDAQQLVQGCDAQQLVQLNGAKQNRMQGEQQEAEGEEIRYVETRRRLSSCDCSGEERVADVSGGNAALAAAAAADIGAAIGAADGCSSRDCHPLWTPPDALTHGSIRHPHFSFPHHHQQHHQHHHHPQQPLQQHEQQPQPSNERVPSDHDPLLSFCHVSPADRPHMHEVAGNHSGVVTGLRYVTNPAAVVDRGDANGAEDAATGADRQVTNEGQKAAGVAANSVAAAGPVGVAVGFGNVGSSAVGSGEAGSGRVGGRWTDCYCEECNDAYEKQALHFTVVGGSAVQGSAVDRGVVGGGAVGGDVVRSIVVEDEKPMVPSSSSTASPLLDAECKEKPTVILLHGFGAASSFWTDTAVPFLPRSFLEGRRVFAVDLLGWGKSPKPRDCEKWCGVAIANAGHVSYSLCRRVVAVDLQEVPNICILQLSPSVPCISPTLPILPPFPPSPFSLTSWIERTVLAPLSISTFHIVGHSMGCLIAVVLPAPPSFPPFSLAPTPPNLVLHTSWIERTVLAPLNISTFHIVGHSMGCLIAAVLAARNRDRVVSVCLYSPVSDNLSHYWEHTQSTGSVVAACKAACNRDRVVSVCLYSPVSSPLNIGITGWHHARLVPQHGLPGSWPPSGSQPPQCLESITLSLLSFSLPFLYHPFPSPSSPLAQASRQQRSFTASSPRAASIRHRFYSQRLLLFPHPMPPYTIPAVHPPSARPHGPPIVPLVLARSALALSGPARTVSRCPAATCTACPSALPAPRECAACSPLVRRLRPTCATCALPVHYLQHPPPAPRAPAAREQPAGREQHLPQHTPLLSAPARPAAQRASAPRSPQRQCALLPSAPARPAAHSASAPCCPARQRAPQPSAPCLAQPRRPALPSCTAQAEACRPARAALPIPSRAALPHSPAPPSRPAAATDATGSAGGAGGAAGSAGGAAASAGGAAGSAGGATGSAKGAGVAAGSAGGAAIDCHCLSWPLSRPGGGGFGFMGTAQRRQQRPQGTFSLQRLRDYASQRCVPGCVEAAALGASASAAALGARDSAAALGASASTATGPASAEALHTFTLDSGTSCCFFCDCTIVTPLAAPVPVSLADPIGGPVIARASTVLPCPAVPSGSLLGLHLLAFLTNLLSNAVLQDVWVDTLFLEDSVWRSVRRLRRVRCLRLVSFQHLARVGYSPTRLLWHHRLAHPSLPRLHSMHSRLPVSGLPRSLPPLPRSPTPPCLPCIEGRQRAAPHSFEFPPTTAPLQTLHMDVWATALVSGTDQERYFLLVVDDYTRCTTVFPLRRKADVSGVLIPWIRAVRSLLASLKSFVETRACQTFTLQASPQQNGIAKRRIGLIMEVARTSMIHVITPHFLRPFAVQYVAHQLNIWPRVSEPETSPTLRSTTHTRCGDSLYNGSELDYGGWHELLGVIGPAPSDDTPATRHSPCLETPPGFPPRPSSPPHQHAAVDSGAAASGDTGGEGSWGAATGGAAIPSGGRAVGDPARGPGAGQPQQLGLLETLLPQQIRAWIVRRGSPGGGGYGPAGAGAASPGGTDGAGGAGGTAGGSGGAAGAGGTRGAAGAGGTRGAGAAGAGGAGGAGGAAGGAGGAGGAAGDGGATGASGTGGAGAAGAGGARGVAGTGGASTGGTGGTKADDGTGTAPRRPFFYPQTHSSLPPADSVLHQVLSLPSSTGLTPPLFCPPTDQSQPQLLPGSPLPAHTPHTAVTESLTERREPETRASTPSDLARAASPTVTRLLATVVTDPDFESTAAFALVTELVDFAARSRLDYVASLVTESESVCPPSVGGEPALSSDILEDGQFELECLAADSPRVASMLLSPLGDLDALDIPTPCSYAEVVTAEYSSKLQTAMDAEMASWKSTGTYVDEVPPLGANIVDGIWIFRVKRPPGSPLAFKVRYVARGFSQQQGVDFFQTFSPTPKMTTLLVLLHVAAQRDYELHSLKFSTAFLQGSLHEEIWLCRPHGFTGSFPVGTQSSLRRPVYGLRQAPQEWQDTLRTTLVALGFAPSSANPSLFLCTDTTLPPFYVLLYVNDLVFATPDIEALALVKAELQERHTCIDMGPPSDESVEVSGPYPELVGCLMYLMTCTRPDLAYPLNLLARYVAPGRHRKVHWDVAKRVLRYLCSTSGMGLMLGGQGSVVLTGHSDASWADDQATQRSSQGYTFCLGFGSVSWRSTRSSSVLGSSCEAKIYVGAMATQELRWLTYLLTDLGERPRSPPILYVVNKAMLALCHEQRLKHRMKHIALHYYLARELQQRGQLRLSYVGSRANTADVFTKALGSDDLQRFFTALGLLPVLPHLLVSSSCTCCTLISIFIPA